MANEKLLEIKNLTVHYQSYDATVHAVENLNLSLGNGETLGLVGETGAGKTTTVKSIMRILPTPPARVVSGEIFFNGQDLLKVSEKEMRKIRGKEIAMIFQDPYSSLDGRKSVFESIGEPLVIQKVCKSKKEYEERVYELMETVGLAERLVNAYPHELDGGRRQRVGIARALALNPEFLVLDEPVSALDVSIQAQVLNLMQQLQKDRRLTYLFISHNLSVVKHISDRIAVMYLGRMVELADCRQLFKNPVHPYTKALLSAVPIPRLDVKTERILLEGDVPSPVNPAPGCRFAGRCAQCMERCTAEQPELREIEPGHFVACHLCDR